MTALTRNKRFGAITGFAGPLPSPLIALAGPSRTVLHAQKTGEQVQFLGESADLGGTVLAGDNTSGSNCHVLTSAGLVLVSNASVPVVSVSAEFDPGDGRWLARVGNFVVTPLAFGGVQVVRYNTLARVTMLPNLLADSRFAASNPALGHIWIVDGRTATIGTVKIDETSGALEYIGKTAAPNCREIVKVVLDADTGDLFVVCRRRIMRFTVPLTDVEDPRPTFAQDYGIARVDYTDFVVVGESLYWIGQDSVTAPSPLPAFYGPMFGVWDPDLGVNGELFVAAPRSAVWTVNNVIPVYSDPGDTVDPPADPPDVIAPPAPVITSDLTDTAVEDAPWSYTIVATGEGPITYGVVDAPPWLTDINAFTGVIGGTPTDLGTYDIIITATNAGGTDTEHLTLVVGPIMELAYTIGLGALQALGTDTPFPEGYLDMFSVPTGRTVAHFYIETVTLLEILSDPAVGCAISAGTNAAVGPYGTIWSDIIPQRNQNVALGGNTDYPAPAPNTGPYSPSLVKFRVALNGSIAARFNQLTAGEFFVRLTLDPP